MRTRFLTQHILLAAIIATGAAASTCSMVLAQDAPAATAATNELIPLRAKWTAGEKLSYEMRIDGTINMQVSRNTPSPFSGVPLDIDMKMLGATTLETLKVDEMGTGTVAMSLDGLKVLAQSFGQKAEITMQDGETVFMLNGKRMGAQRAKDDAKKPNEAKKVEAPFSLEISDRGQILRAIAPEPKNVDKGAAPKAPDAMPFNFEQMAQSAFWRIVPALWPAQAVKIGDKWSSDIAWPPPALVAVQENQGQTVTTPAQLGHFDFTLRNSENVAGRRVFRVGVDGKVELDEKQSRDLSMAMQAEADKRMEEARDKAKAAGEEVETPVRPPFRTQLQNATQKIVGDIWVDADKGQIVRAELNVETQTSAQDVPDNAKVKLKDGESWFDFAGTMQLQLKPPTATPVVMP